MRGKEPLKTQEKFYLADTALRYSVLGYHVDTIAASLENVVLNSERTEKREYERLLEIHDNYPKKIIAL